MTNEERAKVDPLGFLKFCLEVDGCSCDCGHRWDEHDGDCGRCLACCVQDALPALDAAAADLLATRRALKRAQAKGLLTLAEWYVQAQPDRSLRVERLLNHYASKFEQEAEEMGT